MNFLVGGQALALRLAMFVGHAVFCVLFIFPVLLNRQILRVPCAMEAILEQSRAQ
jgi:hypothetical protein